MRLIPISDSGKITVLRNRHASKEDKDKKETETGGAGVQILGDGEGTKYLGRYMCLQTFHDQEVDNRIRKAWKKFWSLKAELCCKDVPLTERVKLFEATVTATALYGSGSWTMTAERRRRLRTAERRMLRHMTNLKRKLRRTDENEEEESEEQSREPDTTPLPRAIRSRDSVHGVCVCGVNIAAQHPPRTEIDKTPPWKDKKKENELSDST